MLFHALAHGAMAKRDWEERRTGFFVKNLFFIVILILCTEN